MRTLVVGACLAVLFFAVPTQAQTVTAAQKADIEKAVREVVLQSATTAETMDVDALAKLWSRDRFIGQLSSGRFVANPDKMFSSWRTAYASRKAQKFELPELTVWVLSPDTALAIASGSFRNELKNGNVFNYDYAYSMVLVKELSTWKIAYLAETAAAKQ